MRRKQSSWGGRAVPIFIAGFAGYLVGGWNASAPRTTELSAAQIVALRFPQDFGGTATVSPATLLVDSSATRTAAAQSTLLNPKPMVPQVPPAQSPVAQASITQTAVPVAPGRQAPVRVAAAEQPAPSRAIASTAPQPSRTTEAKQIAAAIHRHVNERPGFMLNDAQIASIKERLHLTPDQEEMWPAVEAALRNLAYTRAREAGRHGAAADAQLAAADPNSVEVQGLKSAAIPLLMSFNSEQKDEVRNLAHVMGLDQLASQF
jgi:hypothetical protein